MEASEVEEIELEEGVLEAIELQELLEDEPELQLLSTTGQCLSPQLHREKEM